MHIRSTLLIILNITLAQSGVAKGQTLEPFVRGLTKPIKYVPSSDSSGLVVEQRGVIKNIANNVVSDTLWLDIRDRVFSGSNECGLLGLALHPNFAENGRFFVNYTTKINVKKDEKTVSQTVTRISEFKRNANGTIDTKQEKILLSFDQPFDNHNGGEIEFGPDGFLYIGTGDGGSGGDPLNAGQRTDTFLGKILRIDVDRTSKGKAYAIPQDNPFIAGGNNSLPEIYAYGLRNPWRFSFDKATGLLWAADVGQNALEEIDIIEKGKNYGWKVMEGSTCFRAVACNQQPFVKPVFEYGRDEGQSITGGVVYHGTALANFEGKYIYGDYVSGNIWALSRTAAGQVSNELILTSSASPSAFALTPGGQLIVVDHMGALLKLR